MSMLNYITCLITTQWLTQHKTMASAISNNKSGFVNHVQTNGVDDEQQANIWSSILTQVQTSSSNKLPSNKSIIVLGEHDSGKTSLIAKMQGNEDTKKGSGLEYHHLLVRDEYRDEQTRCGVWVLDGDCIWHSHLLKFALNQDNFADTTLVLTASMTQPWDILNTLFKWTKILQTHIDSLNMKNEILNKFKRLIQKRYQEYISPGDEIEGLVNSPIKIRSNSDLDSSTISNSTSTNSIKESLPEGVLTHNLGLDIVVVITKTDYMSVLEKEYDYKEEFFDFIQQAIRKFCLKFGASLFYVSVKANKNCDLLYKHLVHRIYGLKFKTPALVVEKDAIFIPSGWDNEKKISILYENIQFASPDDNYNDVIVKPANRKALQKEAEISAEDDQVFLLKMQTQLNQQAQAAGNREIPLRPSPNVQKTNERRTPLGTPTPGVQIDGAKNSPGNEGVLQTFFNSLLNRKSVGSTQNSPRTPGSMPDNRTRNEVAAELDRMIGSNNSTPQKSLDLTNSSDQ